jgi:hypothetical protein
MKKTTILSMAFVLVFFSMTLAAWTSWEDFNAYKDAKKTASEAETAGDTTTAVLNYKKAADLAGKSATKDIQAWQLNNAGFVLVKRFKELVAYDEKLARLTEMKPSKEKLALQKEMANMYSFKMDLLTEAKKFLEPGKALNGGEEPTKMIQSNIDFIGWVENFIKENTPGDKADPENNGVAKGTTVTSMAK